MKSYSRCRSGDYADSAVGVGRVDSPSQATLGIDSHPHPRSSYCAAAAATTNFLRASLRTQFTENAITYVTAMFAAMLATTA
jgi:hypothetical protein